MRPKAAPSGIDRRTEYCQVRSILHQQVLEKGQSMISKDHRPERSRAFTLLELLASLAALGLLVALALPALGNNKERSWRLLCLNNLRLAGQGFQEWGTDHSGRVPWRTPWSEGGTMQDPSGLNQNLWYQWAWLSNQLQSPKILVCPSDPKKRPATRWDSSPNSGFLHPNYQNRSVSYFIGLDVLSENHLDLVAGDRNVRFNVAAAACSSGVSPAKGLNLPSRGGDVGIEGDLHSEAGNFLGADGGVEELSSQSFVKWVTLATRMDDNAQIHFLTP